MRQGSKPGQSASPVRPSGAGEEPERDPRSQAPAGRLGRYAAAARSKRRAAGRRLRSYEGVKVSFAAGKLVLERGEGQAAAFAGHGASHPDAGPPPQAAGGASAPVARPERVEPVGAEAEALPPVEQAEPARPSRKPAARLEEGGEAAGRASRLVEWRGHPAIDRERRALGTVEALYVDMDTGAAEWALVTTGQPGDPGRLVPVADAVDDAGRIRVRYGRAWVSAAPSVIATDELGVDEQDKLRRHYGLSDSKRAGLLGPPSQGVEPPPPEPPAAKPLERSADPAQAGAPLPPPWVPRARPLPVEGSSGGSAQRSAARRSGLAAILLGGAIAIGLTAGVVASIGALLPATGTRMGSATGAAVTIAATLMLLIGALVSYFAGGYVAGRMCRSAGARRGFWVWTVTVILALGIALSGALAAARLGVIAPFGALRADPESLNAGGALAVAATFAGSLLAAVLGGRAGERAGRRT